MMNFHVLTLFPEMIQNCLGESITGRAIRNGSITLNTVNIRNFTDNKHGHVDDYPYGGGAGMVMQPEPVYKAYNSVASAIDGKVRVIYLTPQGKVFNQAMAEDFAKEENLIFLCGHYEGIDERVLNRIVTDNVSIGDYVLTGGELPAMMITDAVSRLVPGVLGDEVCFTDESHWDGLLEYPQYSRPDVWHGLEVPEVLLSGDHQKVDRWRKKQSILRTMYRRPDMFQKLRFPYKTRAERKFVAELEAENEDFRNRDPKNLDYRK